MTMIKKLIAHCVAMIFLLAMEENNNLRRHSNTEGNGILENTLRDRKFNTFQARIFHNIHNSNSFKSHKSQLQISTTSNNFSLYFQSRRDPMINKVRVAELTQVYHSIQHSISYRSLD